MVPTPFRSILAGADGATLSARHNALQVVRQNPPTARNLAHRLRAHAHFRVKGGPSAAHHSEETMSGQNQVESMFGEVIHCYTRAQAIEDGVLVDMMQDELADVCRQHYKYPVAVTAAVFDIMQRAVGNERYCNDYAGILHDMLWMSRVYKRQLSESAVIFRVKITGAGRRSFYDFRLEVGPGDEGELVITILLPEES